MGDSADRCQLDCTRRAAKRTAAVVLLQLRRRNTSLLAIASTAPLLGMFGTVVLLMNAVRVYSFRAFSECDCAVGVAEAFVPFALSVPVAIFASYGIHCLRNQIETLDLEMRMGTLDLLNYLARQTDR